MIAGTIAEIWRYPVKSMQGERMERAGATEHGLDGDRRWALRDPWTDRLVTGKTDRQILHATAQLEGDGGVRITLPDGTMLSGGGAGTDAALSRWLGRDVVLETASSSTSGVYQMYVDPDDETSEIIELPTPDGTYLDAGALHVLTTASIRTIAAAGPGSAWDVRRFRPTFLVDNDGSGYPEDAWVGESIRIGPVEATVLMPTLRCGIPGRGQPGLADDIDVVRTLKRERRALLGVYATVDTGGEVAVGDELLLLPHS